MNLKHIDIYTDGACKNNPGPGGYGCILTYNGKKKEISGGEKDTTNNRMEMMAVIVSLESLKERCDVSLYTDSKYVVDSIEKGWAANWRKNNWIKSDKKKALNSDLWERLLDLLEIQKVKFFWIKGHAGHPMNERCDELAVLEAEKFVK